MLNPVIVIFLIGAAVSVIMELVNKKVLGNERAKEVKKMMQEIRSKILEAQKAGEIEKMNEELAKLMKINSEYLKFTIKPMIVSVILFILIVPFLNSVYSGMTVASIPKFLPGIGGFKLSWIWWYAICTFVVGTIVRKILGV